MGPFGPADAGGQRVDLRGAFDCVAAPVGLVDEAASDRG
jgi:hypothetical protein